MSSSPVRTPLTDLDPPENECSSHFLLLVCLYTKLNSTTPAYTSVSVYTLYSMVYPVPTPPLPHNAKHHQQIPANEPVETAPYSFQHPPPIPTPFPASPWWYATTITKQQHARASEVSDDATAYPWWCLRPRPQGPSHIQLVCTVGQYSVRPHATESLSHHR